MGSMTVKEAREILGEEYEDFSDEYIADMIRNLEFIAREAIRQAIVERNTS